MSGLVRPVDTAALEHLLEELGREARAFRFDVAPNPCVGAAVLSAGRVVGRGYHERWGGPHAEVRALEAAERSAVPPEDWDTLVITLEPCSTRGKTGPCTEAILRSGIRTVIAGAVDPDSRHRGAGLEVLRKAGVEVYALEGRAPLDKVAPHFLRWTSHERLNRPRPWTIAKWAQTRTGQLQPPEEHPGGRWISGPEARAEVQVLRAQVDAIVTGVGTVLADDPRLTVRPPGRTDLPPARIVLDSVLRTPPDARLFAPPAEDEAAGPVHVLCQVAPDANRAKALARAGAQLHGLRGVDRRTLRLRSVQDWLWEEGYRRVLLEAGPTLLRAYLDAGFVDQIRVFTGDVRGGRGESLASWLAAVRLLDRADREVGGDSVLEGFLDPA